jgi:hypothetical protein
MNNSQNYIIRARNFPIKEVRKLKEEFIEAKPFPNLSNKIPLI